MLRVVERSTKSMLLDGGVKMQTAIVERSVSLR
jgi:hypothetical protein